MSEGPDSASANDGIEVPHSHLASMTEPKVTTLELFFDLVFVFALTQVTLLMADDLTPTGLVRGLAVLAVIWWAWVGFSWLTNFVKADDGPTRLALFASMGAVLVVSLAVPKAFGEWGVQFGAAYLALNLLFLTTYAAAARRQPEVLKAVALLAPGILVAPTLILVAGFLDAGPVRAGLWTVAVVVAYLAPFVSGTSGWRLEPGHFVERHGLIIIIALGESIVSIGAGVGSVAEGLTAEVIGVALVALVIACCLWWLYFDVVALVAERRLASAAGAERNAIARDSYSYLHYLMVAGIVLAALGVKKTLLGVDKPLPTVALVALLGGLALYLIGHVLFRLRNIHSLNRQRLVVAAGLVVAIPLVRDVDSSTVLVGASAALIALVAFETIRFREARHRVRHHGHSAPAPGLPR